MTVSWQDSPFSSTIFWDWKTATRVHNPFFGCIPIHNNIPAMPVLKGSRTSFNGLWSRAYNDSYQRRVTVNVKWGGKKLENVEVDTAQPGIVFKTQLYTLTGVPPERQKIMVKGGMLKVYRSPLHQSPWVGYGLVPCRMMQTWTSWVSRKDSR